MKSLLTFASLLLLSIGVASCTGNDLDAKKAELEGLKSQLSEITTQIKALEAELIAADPAFAAAAKKSLLITTVAATKETLPTLWKLPAQCSPRKMSI